MAITKSAKKAIRSSARKRVFNVRRARTMKFSIKEIERLVAEGRRDEAKVLLAKAYAAIDKATKRGIIEPNTAARRKSKVARSLAARG